jgi:hypothetical protein
MRRFFRGREKLNALSCFPFAHVDHFLHIRARQGAKRRGRKILMASTRWFSRVLFADLSAITLLLRSTITDGSLSVCW